MSGGYFDYDQARIKLIINSIEELIERNGRAKTEEELIKATAWFNNEDYYKKYPEEKFWYKYPDEVIEKFKEGLHYLKNAYIYAQRIDWLISGDDSEEAFLERLEEELQKIK